MTDLTPEPAPETDADAIREELREATRRLVRTTDALPDAAYAEPSGLPDWTRAHVLAHLALNAEGLARALTGVIDGASAWMYASDQARDDDIATLAAASPSRIRERVLAACTLLSNAIDAVPPDQADTIIERSPGGRRFRVGDVPRMRLQEVEVHHADLDAGYDRGRWRAPFAAGLVDAMRTRVQVSTGFTAHASDVDRSWTFGDGGPVVSGALVDLAWWLTGRGSGEGLTSDGEMPRIGGI